MMRFITQHRKAATTALVVGFWLAVWQLAAVIIDQPLFLPPLTSVAKRFAALLAQKEFYASVAHSTLRILLGYGIAAAVGALLAAAAHFSKTVRALLHPLVAAVKATPVASFIVLAFILVHGSNLSTFIAFLMTLPVIYTNVLAGFDGIDPTLFHAADVFCMSRPTRAKHIYLPHIYPYFKAGCVVGVGLAFKAGVAAEVIAIAKGTVGEKLYDAKIYLDIPELFAYTVVIVAVSLLLEKLAARLLAAGVTAILGEEPR